MVKVVIVGAVTIILGISGNSFAKANHGGGNGSSTVSASTPFDNLINFISNWEFGRGRTTTPVTATPIDPKKQAFEDGKKILGSSLEAIKNYSKKLEKCLKTQSLSSEDEFSEKSEKMFNDILSESVNLLKDAFSKKYGDSSKNLVDGLIEFVKAKIDKAKNKKDENLLTNLEKIKKAISKLVESDQLLNSSDVAFNDKIATFKTKVKEAIEQLKNEEAENLCFVPKKGDVSDSEDNSGNSTSTQSSSSTPKATETPSSTQTSLPNKERTSPEDTIPEIQEKAKNDPALNDLVKLLTGLNKPQKDPSEEEIKKIKDMLDPLKKMLEELSKNEPKKKEDDKNPLSDLAKALDPKKDKGGEKGGGSPSGGETPSGGGGDKGGGDPKMPQPEKEEKDEPMPQQQGQMPMLPSLPSSNSQPIPMKNDNKFSDDLDSRPRQIVPETDDRTRGLLELVRLQQQLLMAAQQTAASGGVNSVASRFQGVTRRAPVQPYRYNRTNGAAQIRSAIPQGARTIPSALKNAK